MYRIIVQRTKTNLYIQKFSIKKFCKTNIPYGVGKNWRPKFKNKNFGKKL